MTPTAVLIQPTTTTTIMTSTASNILSKNDFSLSNGTNGPTSSHFGVYQQTMVRSSDVSIQKLVPAAISTAPYCKALIAKFFFHQIIDFPNTPSVSLSNLMTTVASYLSLNTDVTERKVEKLFLPFSPTSLAFLIYRVLGSPILLGNLLRSQIWTSAM